MCPWDSAFGDEFDIIANGEILAMVGQRQPFELLYTFGLPCQSMTWARSPPVRSWDSIWGKSGLVGLASKRVQAADQLLLFTMQLCVVLYEAGCYFPVEKPELCWTWAFAVVAFVHNLPGVAVVKVYYDQFGTRYSKPTLLTAYSKPICLVCIPWQTPQGKGLENKFS